MAVRNFRTAIFLLNFSKTKKTVGIRMPDNAIALAIVRGLGNPMIPVPFLPTK